MINYGAVIGPHRDVSTNPLLALARRLERDSAPDAVVISDHLGVELYARYFARREAYPLRDLYRRDPGDPARHAAASGRALAVTGSELDLRLPWALAHVCSEGEFNVSAVRR